MDSHRLKYEALHWLRFGRNMPVVCTEAGMAQGLADVIGLNSDICIEVETKISKADLKREWTTKKSKHQIYASAEQYHRKSPNYFYFLVPAELGEYAVKQAKEHNDRYGVMVLKDEASRGFGDNLKSIKKASKLHEYEPSVNLVGTAIKRMSSELVGVYRVNEDLRLRAIIELDRLADSAVHGAFMAAAALDLEEADHLVLKAMELAFCVDGVSTEEFQALDELSRARWTKAAQRSLDAHFVSDKNAWLHARMKAYR